MKIQSIRISGLKEPILLLLLCSYSYMLRAQELTDNLFLRDRLQPVEEHNIFKTDGYFNWGASIIKGNDGKYHMFYSRWKKEYGFLGWLIYSEIAHAVAKDPAGPWKYKETVLTGRGKGHWDAITAHNPKIKFFDGKYYLYYISTNMGEIDHSDADLLETAQVGYDHKYWKVLRPNQRTGVAVLRTRSTDHGYGGINHLLNHLSQSPP